MNKFLRILTFLCILISFNACKNRTGNHETGRGDALVSHIDSTVKPGEDFFLFANGRWFRENPIPASEQSNGLWQLIQDTINSQVRNLCESSAALANAPKGSNRQKIGDLFFTAMDSISLNKKGISDLKPELEMIDAISDLSGVAKAGGISPVRVRDWTG
jgi:putative endopeptidase